MVCCQLKLKKQMATMYTDADYAGDHETSQEDLEYHRQIQIQQHEILDILCELKKDSAA